MAPTTALAALPDLDENENELEKKTPRPIIGYWIPVSERMPDDEIACLVWSTHHDAAMTAAHDSEVLERRGHSGWVGPDGRLILGVSHWCDEILPPTTDY